MARQLAHSNSPAAPATQAVARRSADDWLAQGDALCHADPLGARYAYRRALEAQAGFADAYVNLSALLLSIGDPEEALRVCDQALRCTAPSVALWFNRALASEDLDQSAQAEQSYQQCLALEPACADAHHNLARLFVARGDAVSAQRHLQALRRCPLGS